MRLEELGAFRIIRQYFRRFREAFRAPGDTIRFRRILEMASDRPAYKDITYRPIDFTKSPHVYRILGG